MAGRAPSKTSARGRRGTAAPEGKRRLPVGVREQCIVEAAAEAFAELGFGASTRVLASRMGVSQALIYRYFPSKDALIARIFDDLFGRRWDPAWDSILAQRDLTLQERLAAFYAAFFERMRPVNLRLFLRANLDGLSFASKYAAPLTERYLAPVVRELRHAEGLPGFDTKPLLRGERELALMLHGSIVFLGIRRHVYAMSFPAAAAEIVAYQIQVFLAGAPAILKRLHALPEDAPLAEFYNSGPAG